MSDEEDKINITTKTTSTYKGSVAYKGVKGKGEVTKSKEFSGDPFIYWCKFCQKKRKCSKYGNSCGSKKWNEEWDKERGIIYKGVRSVARLFK